MSLFPAASALTAQDGKKDGAKISDEWLKNQSFCPERASELVKLHASKSGHPTSSENSDSDEDRISVKQIERQRESKKQKKKKKRYHSPAEDALDHAKDTTPEVLTEPPKGQKLSVVVDQLEESMPKFCTDPKSDMDNVHFGRLYKVHVPKYYRSLVYCVGTPKWRDIMMRESKKKKKKRKNNDNEYRYFSSDIGCGTKMITKSESDPISHICGQNFIKVAEVPTDEASTVGNADVEDPDVMSEFTKKRTETLNRRVREDPQNIEVWMEFLTWQDEVMKQHSRLVKEKKIEILNQAIKANPKFEKFQLMRIRLQSEVSTETSTIDKEWQNLLFRFPDSVDVWQGYISYITCSDFNAFSIKRTRRAFAHCLEILRSIKDGTYKQEASVVTAEERLVQVFTEYTDFLAATGHTEQWVALYQCVLEVNFRGPTEKLNRQDLLDYMRQYFEGRDPKLGEDGSKGFRSWVEKHEAGGWVTPMDLEETEDPEIDEEDLIDSQQTLATNWLKLEKFRTENHWLPWRPLFDGDQCEDDDRKVSFSDLKELIFITDKTELKIELIRNFLRLLGAPVHSLTTSTFPFSHQHPFFFSHPHHVLKSNRESILGEPTNLFHGTVNHNLDFSLRTCRGCLSGALSTEKHRFVCRVFTQLLSESKDHLMNCVACEYMAYYENRIMSFYTAKKPQALRKCGKVARKTAKNILSSNPELLKIWCSLGVIEWMAGKAGESCRIFQTTLSMSCATLDGLKRRERTRKESEIHYICRRFAQLHFYNCPNCSENSDASCGSKPSISAMLAALGDKYKFSECFSQIPSGGVKPTQVIKSSSGYDHLKEEVQSLYLQEEFEGDNFKMENLSSYFNVLCCHVVFLLMTRKPTSMDVIEEGIVFLQDQVQKGSTLARCDLERLHHMKLFILRSELTRHRKQYREAVYSAVRDFPTNPLFSHMLSDVDLASYLSGSVRRHFTRICNDYQYSVVPWLCAIQFELLRRRKILEASSADNGTNESNRLLDTRIRNLFEHALNLNSGSVALWRGYLAAEAEIDINRVDAIYTRAVNACSWSRDLHMDMLSLKPDLLNEVVTTMSKKGLRLRTPVEEVQLLMTF